MKPDGVITATLEPMETLESNPVDDSSPGTGQEPSQGSGAGEERPEDAVPPQLEKPKESPAAKTANKISADPKAKTTTKTMQKTKPTTLTKTTSGSRPSTASSRLSNGLSKPQSNGVTKKTTPTLDKKSTPTSAAPKKPTAAVPAPRSTVKVIERKTASPSTNGAKSTVGTTAIKKTTSTAVNGVKTSTATAAKKPPAPKPASTTSAKTTTALKTDKPPVSKTSRPTTASRPSTGSTRPPSTLTTKSSASTSKPATPKTSTANNAASKSASSTPSAVKTPTSQTSRNLVKKDVTKSSTPAAKKSADSPLSRPSATMKSTKSETPKLASKSDSITKKTPVSKVSDTKTPNRSKTQENKSAPSKDVSKTPASKTMAAKNTSAKKTVGSSTPTPVKRGPKVEEAAGSGKEIAAAVAAAAAIASAATAIAGSDEPQVPAEVPLVESHEDTAEQLAPQIASSFDVQGITSVLTPEASPEQVHELTSEIQQGTISEPIREPTPEPKREPSPELTPQPTQYVREPTPEFIREPTPEPVREPTPEFIREPTPEPVREPTPEFIREPTPEPVREPTPEPSPQPTPEFIREPTPEPVREPTPEPLREQSPEPLREPTPEPQREHSPEPLRESSPESMTELTPEHVHGITPQPLREHTPEPERDSSPEPLEETTPEVLRDLTPETFQEQNHESLHESKPELLREMTPELKEELVHAGQMSPEVPHETFSQFTEEPYQGAGLTHEPAYDFQQPAPNDPFKFQQSASESVPSLGTTVMSPPCSPPVPVSPVREFHNPSAALLNMDIQPDPWNRNQTLEPCDIDPQPSHGMMNFPTEYNDQDEEWETRRNEEEREEDEEENLMTCTDTFGMMAQPQCLGASTTEDFISGDLLSPREKEVAVEKADEEINEDDDEDEEDEEQRRLGHQLSSMITDMSTSQPSEEFQIRPSAFGGSSGWHCDDLGMDSEDVSSCTSSRQQGISDLSSTQHTAILEGTQSSDALIDSSLRGSEGDGNFMGSPNVETLANEEDDDDDERVDEMDLSSERAEEHHKAFQQGERDEDDEDEDVEMHSDGVTESCDNAEEEDSNEEGHLDNLNRADPPATSWGQTNPFADTWAQPQPASRPSGSSPSSISDHAAGESESPMQSPAQTGLDGRSPFMASLSGQDSEQQQQQQFYKMDTSVPEDTELALAAVGIPESTAQAAHSGSETSTPEELRDYDSSSGVESRSDKQHTPVPASLQPDLEQDLGIHLEKGDGEEEEAETLPADEVPGTGPPTAPASAPSSPTTSVDEASDTEGEMQINEPDAPTMMMGERAAFESPTPASNLPALDEDGEAGETPAGEEDEESCGRSPGIFSLENMEQLSEEAKDPSLIKELTLPSAAAATAQAEDLLGRPVDLMPLSFPEDKQPGLDEGHYMFGGEITAHHMEEMDPLEASHHLGPLESANPDDNQPSYYSTICDKTDYLEGNV
ncbi:mucin-2 isoform X3 [Syngnathus scovelli]|uniref:mucin-2 isoform X3 n=1 Tax=Syngnathus scovelli TaxID=161590 RepID=UPI0021100BD9|nr:serine/arginine repetitive matrix protein 2 isoform X4 [Syngnathus scovelli]